MSLNKAIADNYQKLRHIAESFTRRRDTADELLHHTIDLLLTTGREPDNAVEWIAARMAVEWRGRNSAWNRMHAPTVELPPDQPADDAPEDEPSGVDCLTDDERATLYAYTSGVARQPADTYLRVKVHRIRKKLAAYASTGECSAGAVVNL